MGVCEITLSLAFTFLTHLSGTHVYAEGSDEFTMLKKCGAKVSTVQENGQNVNVIALKPLLGLYHPHEYFLTKLGIEGFKGKEIYKESVEKKGTEAAGTLEAVGTSEAEGTSAVASGHLNKECVVCLNEFSDGEDVLKGSCNVCINII
jgi:hypothetical protein